MAKIYRDLTPWPGDFVGFSSHDSLGWLINLGTFGCPLRGLSHCGIVASHPDYDDPLLFESTTQCVLPCLFGGRAVDGVQAHRCVSRIGEYHGAVWLYRLDRPLSGWQEGKLGRFCIDHLGTGYDAIGAFRSRGAGFGWLERLLCRRPEDLHALFCSEFCAAALRECERFNTRDASKFSPNRLGRTLVGRGIHLKPVRIR